MAAPPIELCDVTEIVASVIALSGVAVAADAGGVHGPLGDDRAGKSTLVETVSRAHRRNRGAILVEGRPVHFHSPRDVLDHGVATVHPDLAMVPLVSIIRNVFMGREGTAGAGPFRRLGIGLADAIARGETAEIAIDLRGPTQAVGTLSGR